MGGRGGPKTNASTATAAAPECGPRPRPRPPQPPTGPSRALPSSHHSGARTAAGQNPLHAATPTRAQPSIASGRNQRPGTDVPGSNSAAGAVGGSSCARTGLPGIEHHRGLGRPVPDAGGGTVPVPTRRASLQGLRHRSHWGPLDGVTGRTCHAAAKCDECDTNDSLSIRFRFLRVDDGLAPLSPAGSQVGYHRQPREPAHPTATKPQTSDSGLDSRSMGGARAKNL